MRFNCDLTRKILHTLNYSEQITTNNLTILREDNDSSEIVFYDNKNRQFTIFLSNDIVLIMINGDIMYEFDFRSFINIDQFIFDLAIAITRSINHV